MGKRMILNLIIVEGLFFVALLFFPDLPFGYLALQMWCSPDTCFGSLWMIPQLFTYSLLHGGMFHFAFNLYALWFFGRHCEAFFGGWFVIVAYLASVVIAGVVHLAVSYLLGQSTVVIGASGGVFGILILFALTFPQLQLQLIIPPVRVSARTLVIIYGVATLFLGLGNATGVTGVLSSVAHFAHLGGLAGGYLCYRYRRPIMLALLKL